MFLFHHFQELILDTFQRFYPLLCGGGVDGAFLDALGQDIFLVLLNDAGDDFGGGFYPLVHLVDDFAHGVLPGFDQAVDVVGEEIVQATLVEVEQAGPVAAVAVADDDVAVYLAKAVGGFGGKAAYVVVYAYVLAFDFGEDEFTGNLVAFFL